MREKLALHDSGGFRAGKLGTRGSRRYASLNASWENVRLFGSRTPRRHAAIMQSRPFSRKKAAVLCPTPIDEQRNPIRRVFHVKHPPSYRLPPTTKRAPPPHAPPNPRCARLGPVPRVTTPVPASLVPGVSGFPLLAFFASDPVCPRARGARPCAGPPRLRA